MRNVLSRPAARLASALCFTVYLVAQAPVAHAAPPVVAGYHRLKDEAKADPAALGELLLGELNCLACHKADDNQRVLTKGAPDLANIGARATPQWLRAYLSDPEKVKPGATMPDVFHASEAQAKDGAVDFLTHYLVTLGNGPVKPSAEEGNAILVERGKTLYHTVGCVACHDPEVKKPGDKLPSVPLGELAGKTTVDQLAAFLLDPLKARPHSRMPSSNLTRGEAVSIAVYLLRAQIDNPQAKNATPPRSKGLRYTYYEADLKDCKVETLDKLPVKGAGKVDNVTLKIPGVRASSYGLRFSGAIHIPKDGKYTFFTNSDDGSRVYVDGSPVVDNDGIHAPQQKQGAVDLKAGDHPFTVTFMQGGAGAQLSVQWQGPGIKKGNIPNDALFTVGGQAMVPLNSEDFKVDRQKAQMGQRMFGMLGCASCHTVQGTPSVRPAQPLAALNADAAEGCIGERTRKGLPKYDVSEDQRAALRAAMKRSSELSKPLAPKEQVVRQMAAMNCVACHKRGDVGGPGVERAEHFAMTGEFDMGDEGRLPPDLSRAGAKLKPEAIEQIVFEGKLHVRPVMAARMPKFGRAPLEKFVQAIDHVDGPPGRAGAPAFTEAAARDGRTLVGVKGLGCVNCHGVNDAKSLGMPAPSLETAHDRLKHPFFHDLLIDPAVMTPGTRMPGFWPEGKATFKDIAGGTAEGQINAIWAYLSLGKSMALPAGLEPLAGTELRPADEPIVHRTFMADVGPRAILVGYPEQLSVAFDANAVRLAKTWHGRFFNANGMWEGRGGKALGPLGTDVINLPPGPSFAFLDSPAAPWPTAKANDRNLGGQFKGYVLDKQQRPTFRYQLNGLEVNEQPLPLLQPGGAALIRKFELKGTTTADAKPLFFLAAAGSTIEPMETPGKYIVDGKVRVTLKGDAAPTVRDGAAGKELLIPVKLNGGSASFEVEVSW